MVTPSNLFWIHLWFLEIFCSNFSKHFFKNLWKWKQPWSIMNGTFLPISKQKLPFWAFYFWFSLDSYFVNFGFRLRVVFGVVMGGQLTRTWMTTEWLIDAATKKLTASFRPDAPSKYFFLYKGHFLVILPIGIVFKKYFLVLVFSSGLLFD